MLFGWAGMTRQARMGCLVSGAGYRNPGLLVKMATALDHATDGRAVLGLGAGWFEREHRAFGFEFPPLGRRLDRIGEAAAICRGLLDGGPSRYDGQWFTAIEARNDPPPAAGAAAARDRRERREANAADRGRATRTSGTPTRTTPRRSRGGATSSTSTAAPSVAIPRSIERTAGLPPPCIRPTRDAAVEALTEILEQQAMPHDAALADGERFAVRGPVDRSVAELRRYRDAGLERGHVRLAGAVRSADARGAGGAGPRRAGRGA